MAGAKYLDVATIFPELIVNDAAFEPVPVAPIVGTV